MEGIITSFRRGRTTQYNNQMIVKPEGIENKEDAQKLVGKKVTFVTEGKDKKKIVGEIRAAHGNKGGVRVLFEKGMPGQAVGRKVTIE